MNNFVDFWVGLGYNGWLLLLLILLFFAPFDYDHFTQYGTYH